MLLLMVPPKELGCSFVLSFVTRLLVVGSCSVSSHPYMHIPLWSMTVYQRMGILFDCLSLQLAGFQEGANGNWMMGNLVVD